MSNRTFTIRRALLIPFGSIAGLIVVLLFIALVGRGSAAEQIVLAAITLLTVALFLEARSRRITMTDQGIIFRKFLRKKDIPWSDISHVGRVIIRSKVYLLLTTTRGFFIVSNAYGDFADLTQKIVQHIGPDKVDEDIRNQGEEPLKNRADIISLWIAVAVIFVVIVLKLLSV